MPFSSPQAAQFWLEWTGHRYVLVVVGTASIGIAALLLAVSQRPLDVAGFLRGASALCFLPLFAFGLSGGTRSPRFEFGSFHGSRPLSDRQLANAILKSVTVALISSAVIWAAIMVLIVLIVGERRIHPGFSAWVG